MAQARQNRPGRQGPQVASITTAPLSREADISRRQRRYVISMTIRTLCFVAAVVASFTVGNGWLMWAFIIAAFILPTIAVVVANSAGSLVPEDEMQRVDVRRPELGGRS